MWAAVLGWVVSLLGSALARIFTVETAKYIATRALTIAVIWGLLPVAMFKGFGLVVKYLVPYVLSSFGTMASGALGSNLQPQIVQLWGVGSYLGGMMLIGQGISIYITWMVFKFVWSLLPRWGIVPGLMGNR